MKEVPRGDWYCESCSVINQNVDRIDYVKRKSTNFEFSFQFLLFYFVCISFLIF